VDPCNQFIAGSLNATFRVRATGEIADGKRAGRWGATKNAGIENAMRAKLQGWKMQKWKMQEWKKQE